VRYVVSVTAAQAYVGLHPLLSLQKSNINTEIEYRYSEAPVTSLSVLGEDLADAVKSSSQWRWEHEVSESRVTDCVTALIPKDRNLDISINLLVGFEKGTKLIEKLQLVSR
jgi:hypothetical protein